MLVTVITICYNAEKEIEKTIRSVLDQTFEDLEYIIVDGLSKDNTMHIIANTLNDYNNRKVKVISEPDKGIYDAMNKGIKIAKGEWLNMMNAGDIFANNEVLSRVFEKPISENISFIFSDLYKATSSGRCFRVNMHCSEDKKCLVHQSTIYRRDLHQKYGYYAVTSQIIISDYLFFLQIPVNEMIKIDTVIAVYEGNGISEQGDWCKKQILCADVVFRHRSFWLLYAAYIKWKLKMILPKRIREGIRLLLSEVKM